MSFSVIEILQIISLQENDLTVRICAKGAENFALVTIWYWLEYRYLKIRENSFLVYEGMHAVLEKIAFIGRCLGKMAL